MDGAAEAALVPVVAVAELLARARVDVALADRLAALVVDVDLPGEANGAGLLRFPVGPDHEAVLGAGLRQGRVVQLMRGQARFADGDAGLDREVIRDREGLGTQERDAAVLVDAEVGAAADDLEALEALAVDEAVKAIRLVRELLLEARTTAAKQFGVAIERSLGKDPCLVEARDPAGLELEALAVDRLGRARGRAPFGRPSGTVLREEAVPGLGGAGILAKDGGGQAGREGQNVNRDAQGETPGGLETAPQASWRERPRLPRAAGCAQV